MVLNGDLNACDFFFIIYIKYLHLGIPTRSNKYIAVSRVGRLLLIVFDLLNAFIYINLRFYAMCSKSFLFGMFFVLLFFLHKILSNHLSDHAVSQFNRPNPWSGEQSNDPTHVCIKFNMQDVNSCTI